MNINAILSEAKKMKASDVHFIPGIKPKIRVNRDLIELEQYEPIDKDDILEVYDYFLKGNVDKDAYFREHKVLDTSAEFEDIRLRVNISYSDGLPVIITRLIRNELPTYEELEFQI